MVSLAEIRDRDGNRCAYPACGWPQNLHVHHRVRRSQGGRDEPPNLITLCARHHQWVHANPYAAKRKGLLLSRHTDPAAAPVDHFLWPAQPVLLGPDLQFAFWWEEEAAAAGG